MIYKGKDILDFSDKELSDAQHDLEWLLAHRENKLYVLPERLLTKDGKPKFDFQTINPAFVKIQTEINNELALRKARG